jgi:hypothetical protein
MKRIGSSPDSASTEADDSSRRADKTWGKKELIEAILKVSGAEEAGTSEVVLDELDRLSIDALRGMLGQLAATRKWIRECKRQNALPTIEAVHQHLQALLKDQLDH